MVKLTLSANFNWWIILFLIAFDFSWSSFEDKCFLLDIWYLLSANSIRFLNSSLSTIDNGRRSPAMNFNKASVSCTWRGSEFAYFPFLVMKSEIFAWSFSFVSCESSKWISLCFLWKLEITSSKWDFKKLLFQEKVNFCLSILMHFSFCLWYHQHIMMIIIKFYLKSILIKQYNISSNELFKSTTYKIHTFISQSCTNTPI